jgi:16S rRNA (cytosine967-C5)-methyltransferase
VRAELVRIAVLEIYEQVRREGARADQAMQRVIRREKKLRSVERRAVADAVYGLLRLQGKVDHLLGVALATRGTSLEKLATPTQHLLRYAAWLVLGDAQSAASAVGMAGPEVTAFAWALEHVARPPAPAATSATSADPLSALASETDRKSVV